MVTHFHYGSPRRAVIGGLRGGLVPPSIFGTMETSALAKKSFSRFASIVLDGVLGPPGLAKHTMPSTGCCPCFSVVSEATHEVK